MKVERVPWSGVEAQDSVQHRCVARPHWQKAGEFLMTTTPVGEQRAFKDLSEVGLSTPYSLSLP
jgi:hypothetical protein